MVRRKIVLVAVVALAALSLPIPSKVGAISSEGPTPYILFASHGIQVIAEQPPVSGCSGVYLSTDFVHFHTITPDVPVKPGYGSCPYQWFDAAFVSPSDGWLVGQNEGGGPSVLEHTTDGGATWTRQSPTPSEGDAEELIGFVNARAGWSQIITLNANIFSFQHTVDGGATWATVHLTRSMGCPWLPYVFSTPKIGFAARGLTTVWRTEDGGSSWGILGLPRPSGVSTDTPAIYDDPVFQGPRGTIPVTYLERTRQIVAFDVTANSGRTWRLAGEVAIPGAIELTSRQPTGTCTAGVPQTSSPLPLLSASTPSSWWILRRGPANDSVVVTVAVGHGVEPVGHLSAGLPATTGALLVTLTSADAGRAYLGVGNGREVMYETANGGGRWTPLPHSIP